MKAAIDHNGEPVIGYFETVMQEQINTATNPNIIAFIFSGYWVNVQNKVLKMLLINKFMFLGSPIILHILIHQCYKHTSVKKRFWLG